VNREQRAAAGLAFAFDFAVVGLDDGLGDREAEAAALGFRRGSGAKEALEYARQVLFGDADSLILKRNADVFIFAQRHAHASAGRRVFDRVVDEDQEQLPEESGIAVDQDVVLQVAFDLDPFVIRERRRETAGFFQHFFEVERFGRNPKLSGAAMDSVKRPSTIRLSFLSSDSMTRTAF